MLIHFKDKVLIHLSSLFLDEMPPNNIICKKHSNVLPMPCAPILPWGLGSHNVLWLFVSQGLSGAPALLTKKPLCLIRDEIHQEAWSAKGKRDMRFLKNISHEALLPYFRMEMAFRQNNVNRNSFQGRGRMGQRSKPDQL